MAVKTEKDLSHDAHSLWLKAITAIELRNNAHAVSLIQTVLKETPEFLDGRKQLRRAEVSMSKGKKSFLGSMPSLSMKSGASVKKDPKAAMEQAEKSLENDPYNSQANHMLKEAALAAGMTETAAFALETLAEGNPKETKVLHELGEHYYSHEEYEKAVDTFRRIIDINSSDLLAIKREKDAAAKSTMKSGGWNEAKSYRDVMKNTDEAVSLEQQNRMVLDEDAINKQLGEFHARAEKEPENLDVARKIASLYEQKSDFDESLKWYVWADELAKHVDPNIARKVADLHMKILDQHIISREQFVAAQPDHPDSPQYRSDLEILKKQKAEALIGDARKRVDRNPTDLQFRYELGEQLLRAGFFSDAIPELQKARNNPNVRLKAMNLLGQCYFEKGMLDLSIKQFGDAAREIPTMDALKKEVLYRLGIVYEKMGKAKESLDCMKEIYDVDYGYEDVAKRVEGCTETPRGRRRHDAPVPYLPEILTGIFAFILGVLAALVIAGRRLARAEEKSSRMPELETRLGQAQGECSELKARASGLEAQALEAGKAAGEKLALLEEAQARLSDAFKALSSEALRNNNQSFLELAKSTLATFQETAKGDLEKRQQAISEIVKPVRESLDKVDARIADIEKVRADAYGSLTTQVRLLFDSQNDLRKETSNLVRALRTPGVRGRWGEVQLRRVVELAGMLAYCDFDEQQSVDTEEGRLRPDMIVRLPGGKSIVVDAKAVISAYLDAVEATDDATRAAHLQRHARQVKDRVDELSRKAYWEQFPSAPEFVVLFLPGEMFFSAALENDPTLIESASERRVVLATPTTLIALLKAVFYGWRQQKLAENAQEISALGRELYERLAVMGGHFESLGKNLNQAVGSFNKAVASIETRVFPAARKFKDLQAAGGDTEITPLAQVEQAARQPQSPELIVSDEVRGLPPGPKKSMSWFTFHFQDFSLSFLSILFEGIPFLLLGSLVSGLIDAFVPSETLIKILPKNPALAICLSGLLGGIFPMCECGSVIVVRRFIKKGLPISAAVTYMLASPIVNPIVALSTFTAFHGRSPWEMMSMRLVIGFVLAIAVGFIIRQIPLPYILQPNIIAGLKGTKRAGFTISAAPEQGENVDLNAGNGFLKKLARTVQSATSDFLDVAFFLVIGAAIAGIFNTSVNQAIMQPLATSAPLSILTMIGLRFMLSLCSTSDAFIAASFTTFSFASKLAFLVFGAMFDLKLFFLYQVVFRRRFVVCLGIGLFIAVVLICLKVSMIPQ